MSTPFFLRPLHKAAIVDNVEATASEVKGELEHVCLNRDNLVGINFILLGEFDHTMDCGLSVDHRVVLLDSALHDALVSLFVPVDVDLHSQKVINAQRALDDLERPFHSATSQEQCVHGAERRLRQRITTKSLREHKLGQANLPAQKTRANC